MHNGEVYCTKLVKPGEWTRKVSSPVWPSWLQYTASFCTLVLYSFYYMPVLMQFGSVLGACNTTKNIELCFRPMKTLDFTSVCNKLTFIVSFFLTEIVCKFCYLLLHCCKLCFFFVRFFCVERVIVYTVLTLILPFPKTNIDVTDKRLCSN